MIHRELVESLQEAGISPPERGGRLDFEVVEAAAEARPRDLALRRAVRAVHGRMTAADGLPAIVAGVRRGELIRWDDWTTTWCGEQVVDGRPALVRVARPHAARDPVLRRSLLRLGRALESQVVQLHVVHAPWPALVAHLDGPVWQPNDVNMGDAVVARCLGNLLAAIRDRAAAGIPLPALDPAEVRDTHWGLQVVSLDIGEDEDIRSNIGWFSARMGSGEGALMRLTSGLSVMPPIEVAEALDALGDAMMGVLSGEWHALSRRVRALQEASQRHRLLSLVRRLGDAVPPPAGRAAVGVDLDGNITVMVGNDGTLRWGPVEGEGTVLYDSANGVAPREARRMLRARATAPDNPRLHATIGGDGRFAESACRWIAAALRLRTLGMLLASDT